MNQEHRDLLSQAAQLDSRFKVRCYPSVSRYVKKHGQMTPKQLAWVNDVIKSAQDNPEREKCQAKLNRQHMTLLNKAIRADPKFASSAAPAAIKAFIEEHGQMTDGQLTWVSSVISRTTKQECSKSADLSDAVRVDCKRIYYGKDRIVSIKVVITGNTHPVSDCIKRYVKQYNAKAIVPYMAKAKFSSKENGWVINFPKNWLGDVIDLARYLKGYSKVFVCREISSGQFFSEFVDDE